MDLTSPVIVGVSAWIGIALIYYGLISRNLYGIFDPIVVSGFFIPFAGALLCVLCVTGLVAWSKFALFMVVLAGFGLGALIVSLFFSGNDLRRYLADVLASVSRRDVDIVFILAVVVTATLAVLGVHADAAGDARQNFARLYRPLVTIQSGLLFLSVLMLLSPRLSVRASFLRLILLLLLSVPFSGKAVLAPILYWYGLRRHLDGARIGFRRGLMTFGVVVAGIILMEVAAYGAAGFVAGFGRFTERLWLSGDTYIYAYQFNALDAIRASYHVSFLRYMLHPITSLVGFRAYDRPLGAMMMSELQRSDVLTGPNPHLPVILDFFFPNTIARPAAVAAIVGGLLFGLRPIGLRLSKGRGSFIKVGCMAIAIFCPGQAFLDSSQVLIALISIVSAVGLLTSLEWLVEFLVHRSNGLRLIDRHLGGSAVQKESR